MAVFLLPTFEDPFYGQITQLDGVDYYLEFRYNQREECWYFDISLADLTKLLSGVKVVCGADLIERFSDLRLPQGHLVASSTTNDDGPPGLLDLGINKRIVLTYFDAADELSTP